MYSNEEISQAIDNLSADAKHRKVERQQADYERLLFKYKKIQAESEAEAEAEAEAELERQRKNNPNPRIGMTKVQVAYGSNWGLPENMNTHGKFELWIYDGGKYLYFTNDKLTSIHY